MLFVMITHQKKGPRDGSQISQTRMMISKIMSSNKSWEQKGFVRMLKPNSLGENLQL